MFKNIEELLNDLYGRVASKSDRSRIQNCLKKLGNPQLKLKCIQIAGTNGKGSTTNYVSHILMEQGYKVGTFTSPHLIEHNDRIRINHINISDDELLDLVNKNIDLFDEFGLNMFEIDFVVAIEYFLKHHVDFAIFEAGMGGRLDSTTEVNPLVNCITNIGKDHMQFLGTTIEEIAYEKAGILKQNIVCISAEEKPSCINVFENEAKIVGTVIKYVKPLDVVEYPNLKVRYKNEILDLGDVALYQRKNIAVALGIIEELQNQQINISTNAIKLGCKYGWPGRFEKVSDNPLIYLDGAHNEEGVSALCETIKAINVPTYIIFAALKDKNVDMMLERLSEVSKEVVVTTFENKRARKKEEYPSSYQFFEYYNEAIDYISKKEGMIVVTGSLYFISLANAYIKKMMGYEQYPVK